MPPRPNQNRSYKVKKSDNALTLPGRTTFPQGSYVPSPALNITPYQLGTGTQASGLSGQQGASSAMYPANQAYPTYSMNLPPKVPKGFGVPAQIQSGFYQPSNLTGATNFGAPNASRLAFNTRMANTPGAGSVVSQQTQVPQTVPVGGAAPFGYNAYGERLDSNGNVWNPATAKTDIYGGRFIQPGERRWERVNGRLQQVVYGRNGKKSVIRGRDRDGGQPQSPAANGNRGNQAASQFVSFRA